MPEQESESRTIEDADDLRKAVDRFLTPRPSAATPRDEELLSRGKPLTLAGGLAATAWGEGEAVLLAHGWESRRTHWGAFVPTLIDAGFQVVALDAPAHGDSPGDRTNVLEYACRLVDVGREIGPLVGIVGHSFGAGAAAIAVLRGLEADRVVLISGPSSVVAVTERWGRHHGMSEAVLPRFLRLVEAEVGVPLDRLDITRFAPGLSRPALVVHDRGDDDIPLEEALAVAAAWPGAKVMITERYGHRRILIAKEVIRAVVAFLKAEDV